MTALALRLLALIGLACLIAAQTPPALSYGLGTPGEGRLPYGFWSAEQNAEGAYRWTTGDSRLRFFGHGAAGALEVRLRLIGPQGSRGQSTVLRLSAGGATILEGESPDRWRNYHLLLPPAGPGWATPELQISGSLAEPIPGDERRVGVALSTVRAEPVGGLRPLALAEYAAFAAALMLLVWLALAMLFPPAIAWAAGLASGGLLLLWLRLDPAAAAYWLPPLWGATLLPLGAAGALALARWLAPRLAPRPLWMAGGLGLGLAGSALLWAGADMPGGPLLLGGAILAAAALAGQAQAEPQPPEAPAAPGWYWPALLGLCGLALALRLLQLDSVPFGLWRDEARHGLEALRILEQPGYRPIFVPAADIPALLFYLQALSVGLLGPTAEAVRVVPAIAGGLTTLAIAMLARRLWGPAAGLAAAALLAISAWHITLSRLAFAAVLDPLLSLAALALLWPIAEGRAGRRPIAMAAAAGALLGLALYTYHPARLMPLAAALWVSLRLGRDVAAWRRALPALAACGLALAIIASPLLAYWAGQSGDFNQRVGSVSLLDRSGERRSLTADLSRNLERYALMWHAEGDQNARHNIPGSPALDPASGLLFLVGLILLLADGRQPASRPLLALLLVGLLPGLLSNNAPHMVRTVDAIAPALLIAAYAALRAGALLGGLPRDSQIAMPAAALALAVALNLGGYFGRVPYDPRVWREFSYTADAVIGAAIRGGACRGPALVPAEIALSDVTRYSAHGHELIPFELDDIPARLPPRGCALVPAGLPPAALARLAGAAGGAAPQPLGRYPGTADPVALIYRLP